MPQEANCLLPYKVNSDLEPTPNFKTGKDVTLQQGNGPLTVES